MHICFISQTILLFSSGSSLLLLDLIIKHFLSATDLPKPHKVHNVPENRTVKLLPTLTDKARFNTETNLGLNTL